MDTEQSRVGQVTHGMWKSKEWNSWDHMKRRCYNPNDPKYKDYGGRGIIVCDRWRYSFHFLITTVITN